MANCAQCGEALPRFTFGDASTLCKNCLVRSVQARQQPQATTLPPPVAAARADAASFPQPMVLRFPVTTALVGLNFLVYIGMVLTGVSPLDPTVPQLIRWGADAGPLTLTSEPWRLLTSTFVHAGIMHIGFNMWCLWQLGCMAERVFGKAAYFIIYLLTGFAASMTSVLVHPGIVSVGASGAIFGVCGALIPALYFGRLPVPPAALRATLRSLLIFVVFNLFLGASIAHIDNFAHIGGLVFGLLAGLLLSRTLLMLAENRRRIQAIIFLALALILAGGWRYGRAFVLARITAERSAEPHS